MKYNFLKREVYMPEKYFRKNRHVKLGKIENRFFAVLWFSRGHKARYNQIFERAYGYDKIEKPLLRSIAVKLRRKGIKIQHIYNYGYKLN